jgi:hypothetical protein
MRIPLRDTASALRSDAGVPKRSPQAVARDEVRASRPSRRRTLASPREASVRARLANTFGVRPEREPAAPQRRRPDSSRKQERAPVAACGRSRSSRRRLARSASDNRRLDLAMTAPFGRARPLRALGRLNRTRNGCDNQTAGPCGHRKPRQTTAARATARRSRSRPSSYKPANPPLGVDPVSGSEPVDTPSFR